MSFCPYCENIALGDDRGQEAPTSLFDEVLARGPGVVLTPTRGMFIAGYLLAITTDHRPNYGTLPQRELCAVDSWLSRVIVGLEAAFGAYVMFEHGSALTRPSQGGCIAHAHLHLIPASPEARGAVLRSLDWTQIGGLVDLRDYATDGYAYMRIDNESYVVPNPALRGQWIRQVVAEAEGLRDRWDWVLYDGDVELRNSRKRIKEALADLPEPERLTGERAS